MPPRMKPTSSAVRCIRWLVILPLACAVSLRAQDTKKPLSDADLVDKVRNSTVFLLADNRAEGKGASGSGFILASTGQVVTNYHVINGMCDVLNKAHSKPTVTVSTEGGQSFGEPQIVAWNEKRDLAILQFSNKPAPGVSLGDSSRVRLGEDVISLGFPWSFTLGFDLTFSKGNLSATRMMKGLKSIQHTASIGPGSSGGPLFNMFGEVVGVNYAQEALDVEGGARVPLAGNINFAIPSNDVRDLLSQKGNPASLQDFCRDQAAHSASQEPGATQIFQSEQQCLNPGERVDFSGDLQASKSYVFAIKRLQGSAKLALGVGSSQTDFRGTEQEVEGGTILLAYTPDHTGSYTTIVGATAGSDRTCFLLAVFVVEQQQK